MLRQYHTVLLSASDALPQLCWSHLDCCRLGQMVSKAQWPYSPHIALQSCPGACISLPTCVPVKRVQAQAEADHMQALRRPLDRTEVLKLKHQLCFCTTSTTASLLASESESSALAWLA